MDNEQDVLKSKVTAELINETKIALNNHEHFNKEDKIITEKFNFGNHRERIILKTVNKVFEMLLKSIQKR